jgi:hypothetical protein
MMRRLFVSVVTHLDETEMDELDTFQAFPKLFLVERCRDRATERVEFRKSPPERSGDVSGCD